MSLLEMSWCVLYVWFCFNNNHSTKSSSASNALLLHNNGTTLILMIKDWEDFDTEKRWVSFSRFYKGGRTSDKLINLC